MQKYVQLGSKWCTIASFIPGRSTNNVKNRFTKLMTTGTLGLLAILVITGLAAAFGLLRTASYWPLIGFGGTAFLTWSILFGFVLALNKNK